MFSYFNKKVLTNSVTASPQKNVGIIIIMNHQDNSWFVFLLICIGNSMIFSDIWHKYHE